ncbi:hypothetical protein WMY93_001832 [Mugilogobius chulae]|uniref:Uncharacterized protein n=1 Tax=Mugilogobius chulae TaxID=88201 RepID=A0AAW0PXW2_9GOBI
MGYGKVLWWIVGAGVVITLITIPAIYLNKSAPKKLFSIDDYFNDTIRWKSYSMHWISDKEYLHRTKDGNYLRYNLETKEESLYISNSSFTQVDATDYMLSGDYNYVAFESNYTKKWRHSYSASYTIFNRETNSFVTPEDLPPLVQYFFWGPVGNQYAYVSDFNVFLKSSVDGQAVQVTHNGAENEILNGIPDWTYEEEVFASNGALWWSTNGMYLVYAEFNDTQVHKIEYTWYGTEQYPETVAIPYPKAGSILPKVRLFVVQTSDPSHRSQLMAPASVSSGDHILCSVTWATDQRVAVQWMNRKQNHVIVQFYELDGGSWVEKQKFEQTSQTGWVGHYVPLPLFFAEDKLSFYKVMSDSRGYKHIHYVKDGKATPITSGEWEVIYISKLTKDAIYFVSNQHEGIPVQRNLYRIRIGSSHSAPECLTCGLHAERCQYNSAYFSYDASYYRMDCTGPGLPLYTLMDNRGAGVELSVLEDNKELENVLSDFHMPTMKYGTFKVAGFDLWYQMMLPPNFKKSKKYPLLIDVYGGPCSQTVSYRFKLSWATYLTSTLDIIYASFDGRGSGYQGDQILHSIYHRLGTYEVEDQLIAIKKFTDLGLWIKTEWPFLWRLRHCHGFGIRQWAAKCGISVAPVAEWEYYDAVYTERYMGTPQDNPDGYRNGSVIMRAKNFKNVDFLLIHGTADDNVHFQQAAQISKALVNEQVDFESMWYTDKNHSLRGSAYRHVYTLMSHFLKKCFGNAK